MGIWGLYVRGEPGLRGGEVGRKGGWLSSASACLAECVLPCTQHSRGQTPTGHFAQGDVGKPLITTNCTHTACWAGPQHSHHGC